MQSGSPSSMSSSEPEPPQPAHVHWLSGSMTTKSGTLACAATTRRSSRDRGWRPVMGPFDMTGRIVPRSRARQGAFVAGRLRPSALLGAGGDPTVEGGSISHVALHPVRLDTREPHKRHNGRVAQLVRARRLQRQTEGIFPHAVTTRNSHSCRSTPSIAVPASSSEWHRVAPSGTGWTEFRMSFRARIGQFSGRLSGIRPLDAQDVSRTSHQAFSSRQG
jgi:hypothetical protein